MPRRPTGSSPRLEAACRAELTYAEVGATALAHQLPPGYHHVRRQQGLGVGRGRFDAAVEQLMTWQVHRRAGLTVEATAPRAEAGAVVLLGLGVGRLRVGAPCRVVRVVDEPRRQGFAYGTLPGHPESGEELFEVALDEADHVHLRIAAFSRPTTWWARAGGPVGRIVQQRITDRYVSALANP